MSEIGGLGALDHLGIQSKKPVEETSNELGQEAFMELLITQMSNQDPLNPQENHEMIAQLAQFSQVEGIDRLSDSFTSFTSSFMSNQALQASSLVGRSVVVPASRTELGTSGVVSGSIDIPQATPNASLNIYDSTGAIVDAIPLGPMPAGEVVFRWDGQNFELNGQAVSWPDQRDTKAPMGNYRFDAYAELAGAPTQLETALSANVNSVTLGADNQLSLNLAGLGAVSMDDVKQFN